MGLSTSHLGDSDKKRFRSFRRRTLRSLRQLDQSPLKDRRNGYVAQLLLRILARTLVNGSFVRHYTFGVSYDASDDFAALVRQQQDTHGSVTLLLGGNDVLFPAHEVQQTLDRLGLTPTIKLLPNVSHGSLATRKSQVLLAEAVQAVRAKN